MTSIQGQATVEYAGLLALAALLGATLALVAGPPLAHVVRAALVVALSAPSHRSVGVVASAADISDVQSALQPGDRALTPDAALLALARRHGPERAGEVSEPLLLEAAREAAPWVGRQVTYRAWLKLADGPYGEATGSDGDRDVETPTAAPEVAWITVSRQRRAIASLLAHHTSVTAIALDLLGGGVLKPARGVRSLVRAANRLPGGLDVAVTGAAVVDLAYTSDGGTPPGARDGDVVVAWPVHRTFMRDGHEDPSPSIDLGLGRHAAPQDYLHIVFLRPGPGGLTVIAEGIGA